MHIRLTMLTKIPPSDITGYQMKLSSSAAWAKNGTNQASPEDLPSSVPTNKRAAAKKQPSPLEALASRISVNGPRCNEFSVMPWEAAN